MIEVNIVETSKRGDGIARVKGFVIFVPNTKPGGDKVKVKITRIGRTYAVAEVTQESSPTTQEAAEGTEEETETEEFGEESEE